MKKVRITISDTDGNPIGYATGNLESIETNSQVKCCVEFTEKIVITLVGDSCGLRVVKDKLKGYTKSLKGIGFGW